MAGEPLNKSDPLGLYTVYWGGAGLNGGYINDQIQALSQAGITNVVRGTHTRNAILDAQAVTQLRLKEPYGVAYAFAPTPPTTCGENLDSGQINYIGYSYGSLLAAQTAHFYAKKGYVIDNLVLIGSPIASSFLNSLKNNPNIKNVIVKDLGFNGDPIYAGMPLAQLLANVPRLAIQQRRGNGSGHFYYAPNTQIGSQRRRSLASELFSAGLW